MSQGWVFPAVKNTPWCGLRGLVGAEKRSPRDTACWAALSTRWNRFHLHSKGKEILQFDGNPERRSDRPAGLQEPRGVGVRVEAWPASRVGPTGVGVGLQVPANQPSTGEQPPGEKRSVTGEDGTPSL